MSDKGMLHIVVHDGSFHMDDLLSVAFIYLLHPTTEIKVSRTRDKDMIDQADWVVDVGGVYDHEKRRYDHHQNDRPIRDNGIPYAAFGLLWKHWGEKLCVTNGVARKIDEEFIQMIDGPDNGVVTYESLFENGRVPSINLLSIFWQPNWNESNLGDDGQFFELLPIIKNFLKRLIQSYNSRVLAEDEIKKSYDSAHDKRILEVPRGVGMYNPDQYPEVLFLVSEDVANKNWKAKCVTESGFNCRASFPESWRGLVEKNLQEISKIKTAQFVHNGGFLAVATTKADVFKMCFASLSNNKVASG